MTRKIMNVAFLLVLIIFPTALTGAQAWTGGDEAATSSVPTPQLEFVGKEDYELNGAPGTRYKLSVTNRASYPDFLSRPTQHLAPCGKNENASRTWVEIFGSPQRRLAQALMPARHSSRKHCDLEMEKNHE